MRHQDDCIQMSKPRRFHTLTAFIAGFVLVAGSLSAQTLARPGWVGSGLTQQTWFRHAVFYGIDTRSFQDSNGDGVGDLKGITERLDYIRSLGVDAILLAPLTPASGGEPNTIDATLGTLDDFDELTLQAGRVRIRVLLELPNPDPALARFWLSRGVAGFHIPARSSGGQTNAGAIEAIRKLLPGYVGQRVLITDGDAGGSGGGTTPAKDGANELVLDIALLKLPAKPGTAEEAPMAGEIRAALEQAQTGAHPGDRLLATDAPGVPNSLNRFGGSKASAGQSADLSRAVLTILMLSRSGVLLSAGEELGLPSEAGADVAMPWGAPPASASPEQAAAEQPGIEQRGAVKSAAASRPAVSDVYVPYVAPKAAAMPKTAPPPDPASVAGQDVDPRSPLSFYRQLNRLRHGGTALRDGDETLLDYDGLNALVWIRKPASPSYTNPPIVVFCNLSNKPLAIELKPELQRLHLRGSFLKTILRSDGGMGAMDLSPVRIPPYGVYVGELKF
jgi:alpha-glucosidase